MAQDFRTLQPLVTALRTATVPYNHDRDIAYGSVQSVSTTGCTIQFDGETTTSIKSYPWVGAQPIVGSRVMLIRSSGTWVIMGTLVGNGVSIPAFTTDWNLAVTPGLYYGTSATTNSPYVATFFGYVLDLPTNPTYVTQIVHRVSSGLATEMWIRSRGGGGGWTAWVQVTGTPTLHNVGTTGEPAFQNGWHNYNTSTFTRCRFFKDASNLVHVEGFIAGGTIASDNTGIVFTLPSGYCPALEQVVGTTSVGANATARIDILSSGAVRVNSAPGNTWVTLTGVTFLADGS